MQNLIDTKVRRPDLEGEIHPIFQRERWPHISQERFDALRQSLILSTKLLNLAVPYFTSFLPNPKYHARPREHRIALNKIPTEDELAKVRAELENMAPSIHFEEDPYMWPSSKGWLGITHTGLGRPAEPFQPQDPHDWGTADTRDRRAGFSYRQLTVGLASQFTDVLMDPKVNSERRLCAAFMAAITLTHEIGHVVFDRHFGHEIWWGEPWVGQDVERELGNSLIAWLFGGWLPNPINPGSGESGKAEMRGFKSGLYWQKQFTYPMTIPSYYTSYSIPMAHIQRIMSQEAWDRFDAVKNPTILRQQLLAPRTPFRNGQHARVAWRANRQKWLYSGRYIDYEDVDEDWYDADENSCDPPYECQDWEDSIGDLGALSGAAPVAGPSAVTKQSSPPPPDEEDGGRAKRKRTPGPKLVEDKPAARKSKRTKGVEE